MTIELDIVSTYFFYVIESRMLISLSNVWFGKCNAVNSELHFFAVYFLSMTCVKNNTIVDLRTEISMHYRSSAYQSSQGDISASNVPEEPALWTR